MKSFHTGRNRLGLELLEARENPAGNVAMALSGGALYLTGDALGNQISVAQDAAGQVTITGLDETTVNGQASVTVSNTSFNYLSVNLGDGNDSVGITGLTTSGGIAVSGGNGDDAVTLGNVSAGWVSISGGAGNDNVTFNTVGASFGVKVLGGAGTDTFTNNGTTTPFLYTAELEPQPAG